MVIIVDKIGLYTRSKENINTASVERDALFMTNSVRLLFHKHLCTASSIA